MKQNGSNFAVQSVVLFESMAVSGVIDPEALQSSKESLGGDNASGNSVASDEKSKLVSVTFSGLPGGVAEVNLDLLIESYRRRG